MADTSTRKPGRPKGSGADPRQVRTRILSTFVDRAAREGIRAVSLARLARELNMSLATIYRHFPSKAALVQAAVYEWVQRFAAAGAVLDAPRNVPDAATALARWADEWAGREQRFCPEFWEDLRQGYPDAWQEFRAANQRMRAMGRALLQGHLRRDIDPDLAFELFYVMFRHISDPSTLQRLGIDRATAVDTTVRIWGGGALEEPGRLAAHVADAECRHAAPDGTHGATDA